MAYINGIEGGPMFRLIIHSYFHGCVTLRCLYQQLKWHWSTK